MMTTRKDIQLRSFKARVAIEALRGEKTLGRVGVAVQGASHSRSAKWRKIAQDQMPELFVDGRRKSGGNGEVEAIAVLYEEIGRLKVELDWLKKKAGMLD